MGLEFSGPLALDKSVNQLALCLQTELIDSRREVINAGDDDDLAPPSVERFH